MKLLAFCLAATMLAVAGASARVWADDDDGSVFHGHILMEYVGQVIDQTPG
jgi:hypothetical protein